MGSQPTPQFEPLVFDRPQPVPQHYVAPSARDLRAQSVHRLQVGLFGLAAMLLLVGLANIIMDRARLADSSGGAIASASSPSAATGPQSDPLADIGVVPAASPTTASPVAAVPAASPVAN